MAQRRPPPGSARGARLGLCALLLLGLPSAGCDRARHDPGPVGERTPPAPPQAPRGPGAAASPPVPRQSETELARGACRREVHGSLSFPAPQRRVTLLDMSAPTGDTPAADLDGAAPGGGAAYVLLVEGDGTELLRLDRSLTLGTRRAVSGRFDAALPLGGRVLLLGRGPTPRAGVSAYRATWVGEQPDDDVALDLGVDAPRGGATRRVRGARQALFVWTDGRRPPLSLSLLLEQSPGAAAASLRFAAAQPLSPPVDLEDARAVQVLGLAVHGDRYAGIVRVGAAEASDSQVWLATPSGHVPVDALEDAADIETMAIVDDEVWAIATFEFSRPLWLRIRANGELAADPMALPRDAALPPQLATGDPARLLVSDRQLLLRRRNPMGDPLSPDEPVALRRAPELPADVVRRGTRYLVVYQDRDDETDTWPLRFVSLDCAPR